MVEINTKQGKIKGFEIELKDEIGGTGSTDIRTVETDGLRIPYEVDQLQFFKMCLLEN